MIQVILAIAFVLLVMWLIYTIVMWVWALILDIGAWVEANIVFLLAIGVLIGYVWWRAHLRAKEAQEQEEQAEREIQQRQLARIQGDLPQKPESVPKRRPGMLNDEPNKR